MRIVVLGGHRWSDERRIGSSKRGAAAHDEDGQADDQDEEDDHTHNKTNFNTAQGGCELF